MTTTADTALGCEILASTSLNLLVDLIRGHSTDKLRDSLARMLNQMALWCSRAFHVLVDDPVYGPVIFYERHRLCSLSRWRLKENKRSFFFEGLPHSVAVAGAASPLQLPPGVINQDDFAAKRALSDRHHSVLNLESLKPGSEAEVTMAWTVGNLADLDGRVPASPRIFLARSRSIFNEMRIHRDASWFAQFDNCLCGRLFVRNCHRRSDDPRFPLTSRVVACVQVSKYDYWEHIEASPVFPKDEARFCSSQCCVQWWAQCRDFGAEGCALFGARMGSEIIGETHANLQRALARNQALDKVLAQMARASRKPQSRAQKRPFGALSRADRDRVVDTLIARANVDVGVRMAVRLVRACHALKGTKRAHMTTVAKRTRFLYEQYQQRTLRPIFSIQEHKHPFLRAVAAHIVTLVRD